MSPWMRKSKLSHQQVAQLMQDFLDGNGHPMAWDGFTQGMSFENPYLEDVRIRCAGLSQEFPSANQSRYCNEQGLEVIRNYIRELRESK
jgi:hypothetical protein